MCFFSGSVWAKISATSEKLPSEIHIFWPLIDQPRVGLGRAGAQVGGVGAGVGLGQAEAAERLARAEPRQPLLLLLLGAPLLDRAGDQRGLHRDDGAGRGVGAADLLDDQPVADVVEAAAAVLFGDRGAEVADLAELAGQLAVEAGGAVVLADPRHDLLVGEFTRRFGDQLAARRSAGSPSHPSLEFCRLRVRAARRPQGLGEGLLGLAGARAGRVGKLGAVDRGDGLDLARGRGEEGLAGGAQVVDRARLPSSTSSALTRRSRVIDSSTPASSAGVRSSPSAETQKIAEVGGSSTMPSGRTSTASSAPRPLASRVACMLAA